MIKHLLAATAVVAIASQADATERRNPRGSSASAGAAASAVAVSSSSATGGSARAYGGSAHQHQSQSQTANGNQSVHLGGDRDVRQAPAVTAPSLAVSNLGCGLSGGGGASGPMFGVSIGLSWEAEHCERRQDAITLDALGQRRAALIRMCSRAENAEAMRLAGTPCPMPERAEVPTNPIVGEADPVKQRAALPSFPQGGDR